LPLLRVVGSEAKDFQAAALVAKDRPDIMPRVVDPPRAPRVSIITATYNRPEVLRYAIDSVRRQTFGDWEHVIVGDACSEETGALVESYRDPRLRYINREQHFGEQAGPNNDGCAAARGDLIAYLNHDDLWFPDHLASLTAHLDASGADLVHAPYVSVDAVGAVRCGVTNVKLRYKPSHFVPASLWLITRELLTFLRGWRPARKIHASNPSQDLLVRAWRNKKAIVCVPRVTALILASGGRPGAYVRRDASQHAELFARMEQPEFREQLLTDMALTVVREAAEKATVAPSWSAAVNHLADRLLIAARLHPDAVRNRLRGRPKGQWIAHLREFRGLPPVPPPSSK
jgi:hypothetical protein